MSGFVLHGAQLFLMASLQDIRTAVAEIVNLDADALKPETCFYDLPGFDSVTILSVIVALDDLGVSVPQEKASQIRTFGDVLKLANLA